MLVENIKWVDMLNYRELFAVGFPSQSVAEDTYDILELSELVLNNEFWMI
jgi:hypothetical protein